MQDSYRVENLSNSIEYKKMYTEIYREQVISTPYEIVDMLMKLIGIGSYDVVYDLGCGDGRIVIEAAKRGAFGVCLEINRVLCNIVEIASKIAKVENKVKIICNDMFKVDLSSITPQPTVIYLYHYPSTLEKLLAKLEKELTEGILVISLDAPIKGWEPITVIPISDSSGAIWFLWIYITGYNL